jgi:hypothetical protein
MLAPPTEGGAARVGPTEAAVLFEEEFLRADVLRWYSNMLQGVYVHEPPKPQPTVRTVATCCNCSHVQRAMLASLPTFVVLPSAAYTAQMYGAPPTKADNGVEALDLRPSFGSASPPADADVAVEQFGAVADGRTLNTAAINAAVQHVYAAGGGRVRAHVAGAYVTGRVELLSNVELSIGPARCAALHVLHANFIGPYVVVSWCSRNQFCLPL